MPLGQVVLSAVLAASAPAWAQTTSLADAPLFSTVNAPGNLSLVLSVEFPTAVSVAHANRTYSSSNTYLGYFDESKCYTYSGSTSDVTTSPSATPGSWFVPAAAAASHVCSGQWSGNFLNWASMQTIDTFRWVLTGGYRVVDTSSLSVIEKAWASGQGGTSNFPDSTLSAAEVANATPFGSLGGGAINMRIQGLGNQMRFVVSPNYSPSQYTVNYYNTTDLTGAVIATASVVDTSAIQNSVSPATGVGPFNYSASYTITIKTPPTAATAKYNFRTLSDDGVKLFLDGSTTATISNWNNAHAATYDTGTASVTWAPNTSHTIKVQYQQFTGDATLSIEWQPPGASGYTPIAGLNSLNSGPTPTSFTTPSSATVNTVYSVFMRAKVCDTSASVAVETNCVAYSSGSKPEGLMQKYANKLRYSAFGYLNDGSSTRDAGVLRAVQKFIGPTKPVYGAPAASNLAAEWDSTTGVMALDPDCSSSNPDRPANPQCPSSGTVSSGAMNYINKFGELLRNGYKTYDPVSELYYAAIRYFKNLGNVPEWSTMTTSARAAQMDGFPVITSWTDPVIGSCQKNFILGIGDTHTWLDKNVSGNTNSAGEPALPSLVASDPSTVNAVTATNKVGAMEFSNPALGTKSPYGSCCTNNSPLIAGLAYDAHTTGIRTYTDAAGVSTAQTLDTYWLDVQEGGSYENNNPFYLATKYGGFKVPDGFKPYDAATTALTDASWWNGTDTLSTTNKRPNNYYSASQPDKMQAGLIAAFKDAASKATASFSTSFSLPVPQVATTGSASYSSSYVPATWSGDVTAATLTFDPATGSPVLSAAAWQFGAKLTSQASGTGWNVNRKIVTWNGTQGVPFRAPGATPAVGMTSVQLALLNTSVTIGGSSTTALQYLRGDVSNEIPASGSADSTHYYRTRSAGPLGDIVDSKPTVIATPAFPYGDTSNSGYGAFKTARASRNSVVYVGSNDGMLHAIDGSLTTSSGGTELFAYVPSALFTGPNATPTVDGLASLPDPSFVHHYMVDGPIAYFDIDFARTPGGPAATDWHTVLIGALGKGGKAYYAIDVTDPSVFTSEAAVAGKVLWEFASATSLGYTYGKPVVVKVRKYGWVVALPSGYNNGDGFGHILFLNPRTGALLEDVRMPVRTLGGLAQLNAYILDPTDGTADAFYAGDLDGNIWRLDVTQTTSGAFPSPTKLATLTSPSPVGTAQPVTTVPFIQIDPATRRRFVLVGTGRLLDSTDISSAQVQTFYAIWDGNNVAFSTTPTSGTGTFPITRSGLLSRTGTDTTTGADVVDLTAVSGWYVDLGSTTDTTTGVTSQSRLVSQMTTSYGEVAFAATVPTGTMCSPGGTSLDYGFAFGAAQSVLRGTTGTLPFLAVADTTTNIGFASNNGELALIYGVSNAPAVSRIKVNGLGTDQPRRVNWREVPVAD